MPTTTTYSFADLSGAFAHPLFGSYAFQGQGIGSISIAPQTEKTIHSRAADGSIMVTKIAGQNATVTITVQQTSAFDAFLQDAFTTLDGMSALNWAQWTATLRNPTIQRTSVLTGMAFQREADQPNAAQGQDRTWIMLAAEHIMTTV
jgi:hypothetical protein